jgi:protein-S-isoprenylcysteine O-methyltransferase Ste14
MKTLHQQLTRSSVLGSLTLFLLLFIPAGTLHYWQGWAYIATFVVCSSTYTVYLARHDPALLKRRTEGGISREKERTQKVVMAFLYPICVALVVTPPLDVRFGWSNMPWYLCVFGDALVIVSFHLFLSVSKVNTYAAANIRVEEGQKVISTGMYRVVRHPMYLGALFLLVGTPVALGSWWTLFLIPISLPILVVRILNEEKVLVRDLRGYAEYQRKVTTRLIPFVW